MSAACSVSLRSGCVLAFPRAAPSFLVCFFKTQKAPKKNKRRARLQERQTQGLNYEQGMRNQQSPDRTNIRRRSERRSTESTQPRHSLPVLCRPVGVSQQHCPPGRVVRGARREHVTGRGRHRREGGEVRVHA